MKRKCTSRFLLDVQKWGNLPIISVIKAKCWIRSGLKWFHFVGMLLTKTFPSNFGYRFQPFNKVDTSKGFCNIFLNLLEQDSKNYF